MSQHNEMQITFLSLAENESFARVVIAAFAVQMSPTVSEIADIKTAVSEAVTNAIVHGYEGCTGQVVMRARMDEYGAVVRKLADKYHLTFVDLQAGWDRLFQHMHSTNIAWDRVHPNQTGCMYIAKQFLAAIGADRA